MRRSFYQSNRDFGQLSTNHMPSFGEHPGTATAYSSAAHHAAPQARSYLRPLWQLLRLMITTSLLPWEVSIRWKYAVALISRFAGVVVSTVNDRHKRVCIRIFLKKVKPEPVADNSGFRTKPNGFKFNEYSGTREHGQFVLVYGLDQWVRDKMTPTLFDVVLR